MAGFFRSVLVGAAWLLAVSAAEGNWPQFRGPASGLSGDRGLPDSWSTTRNVTWKTEIPGRGWSSPVVWGERVFVTSLVNRLTWIRRSRPSCR